MKQPDAFEKAVEKYVFGDCDDVLKRDAVTLLCDHHRKVVRMVRDEKVSGETGTEGDSAYNQACDDILAKLKAMEGKT